MSDPSMNPTTDTHVPVECHIPGEAEWDGGGRPPLEVPSLWRKGVKVVHKLSGREAAIHVIDLSTRMFRAYYLDTKTHDSRVEWQHCRDWNVQVTLSPAEEKRVAARRVLEDEIAKLDPKELAAVEVLVDEPDATKALAKLHALRALGVIKAAPEVAQAAITEGKAAKR
jgi:hypothetical protein